MAKKKVPESSTHNQSHCQDQSEGEAPELSMHSKGEDKMELVIIDVYLKIESRYGGHGYKIRNRLAGIYLMALHKAGWPPMLLLLSPIPYHTNADLERLYIEPKSTLSYATNVQYIISKAAQLSSLPSSLLHGDDASTPRQKNEEETTTVSTHGLHSVLHLRHRHNNKSITTVIYNTIQCSHNQIDGNVNVVNINNTQSLQLHVVFMLCCVLIMSCCVVVQ
jgi:hypothetical protein